MPLDYRPTVVHSKSDAPASGWRPEPAPREPWVLLRMIAAALLGALGAAFRRITVGSLRPGWSWSLELIAEAQRANWALMPVVGLVRWRHAADMLVPGSARRVELTGADAAGVPAEWLVPPDASGPVILYVHGGGFVLGSPGTHRALTERLAVAAGARTLAIDYRLSPEHAQPAALEDCCAAYRYLLGSGVDPARLLIAGDSAGGNLALATLLELRRTGTALPAAAALICPWVDLSGSGESFLANRRYDYLTGEICGLAASAYLDGADARDPALSPLFADLSGLPPLLIQVGGAELLHDQVCDFAARARAAGVKVQLSVYDDMIHDWHLFPFLPEAGRAVDEIAAFARSTDRAERS
jgi:acetyl esterase/lipase